MLVYKLRTTQIVFTVQFRAVEPEPGIWVPPVPQP